MYDVGRGGLAFCVYLTRGGRGIAYAGSSGRVEYRLRRRFRGYSSAASGPAPPTFWRAQGVGRRRPHGRRGYTKPTGRPTPPRGRESPRVVHPPRSGLRAGPPAAACGHERPPPKLKPRARDVGWGERRRPGAQERRRICPRVLRRLRVHSSASAPPLGHIRRSRLADTSLQMQLDL
jgi:hypothetical protein